MLQRTAADDDKLFDLQGTANFPDALSDLGSFPEHPNDRQVCDCLAAGEL